MKPVRLSVWIFLFFGLGLFALLMIPPFRCGPLTPELPAKSDVVQIVNGIRNFTIDYGRPPLVTENGFCETAESNARLIRILRGEDKQENPRGIRYIEPFIVKKGAYSYGIHPETGAWIDPWGNFYRVRIATDSARIPNPDPSDGPNPLEVKCIAWSLGKDGVQDFDDVQSWK